jgi:hypothetical protein
MNNSEEILNKLWYNWVYSTDLGTSVEAVYPYKYHNKNKNFEDWLLDNGVRVVQKNMIKYIEFNSDKQKTWFLMKYG